MANIKINTNYVVADGAEITFKAPCDCSEVSGLSIHYPDVETGEKISKVFAFKDAHGNDLASMDNLFTAGVYVKVVLSVTDSVAYIQNADTNSYLEDRLEGSGGSTVNILRYPYYNSPVEENDYGIKWVENGDGTVTANGTNTGTGANQRSSFICRKRDEAEAQILKAGTYALSGCPKGGSTTTYFLQAGYSDLEGNYVQLGNDTGDGITFTLTEDVPLQVIAFIANGATIENITFKPTLVYGESPATYYVPYYLGGAKDSERLGGHDSKYFTDYTDKSVSTHTSNISNPHGVTKSQVGLGNVPNVTTNDQTPTYTVASADAELTSGEKLGVAFGKIAKAVKSLISHLADTTKHITSSERTAWNAKAGTGTATTSANGLMSSTDKSKLDGIDSGANAYTHPNSGVTAGTYRSVTVNAQGHVTAGSNPTITVAQGGTGATDAATARANIGAAASSHGNHVPTTQTADNATFLRNDNTWQKVTPANIGAAASSHGTHVSFSTTAPVMDGTASAGSASTVARSDHKHPVDTSRAAASHTHKKSEISDFPTTMTPTAHTHTKSQITDFPTTMTPSSHTHAASQVTAGTLGGAVVANATAVATLGTKQVRNIYAGTGALTDGSSALPTGDIYIQYE